MIKKSFVIIFLLSCAVSLFSQNNTSSPYTRYGYGNLVDAGFGESKGMGGLSYGLRTTKFVNPGNPASFTAIDSFTFRFEAGVAAKLSVYTDDLAGQTKFDANLEYLAMQFPITRWLGFSMGLIPSSFVGYDFYSSQTKSSSITEGSISSTTKYEGKGGIRQFYFGLGAMPLRNLSLGASAEYSFGKIEHSSLLSFDNKTYASTSQYKKVKVKDFNFNLGAQFEIPLSGERKITIGAVVQPKSGLTADAEQEILTSGIDTVNIIADDGFETPLTVGFGFVYNFSSRWIAGLDYKRQNWSDAKYFGEKPFADRNKVAAGVELLPNNLSKRYLERIYYRFGANYSNSYIKVNDETLNEYTLSAGFGLPLRKGLNPTVINLVIEYGSTGKTSDNLVREQFFKFTLNATINERWFVKYKFD